MHRHVRRIGDQVAGAVEHRAGEIEPLLDIDRGGGGGERHAHLLGDRHEQVVEHFEHHRIDVRSHGRCAAERLDARQHQFGARGDAGPPARFNHRRAVGVDEDRRAIDRGAGGEARAIMNRRFMQRVVAIDLRAADGLRFGGRRRRIRRHHRPGVRHARDRLDRHGLDHQRLVRHEEAVGAAIGRLERGAHGVGPGERHRLRLVGALVAQMRAAMHGDARAIDPLRQQRILGLPRQKGEPGSKIVDHVRRQPALHGLLAQLDHVGEPHAESREHTGQRMNEDRGHAERVGHLADMLAAGTAKAHQRIAAHVAALLDRDLLDGMGDVLVGDAQEAVGEFLRRSRHAGRARDLGRQRREFVAHHVAVERQVAVRAEDAREMLGPDLTGHDIGVGDGERTAAAVAGGPGIGTRRPRPDAQARSVEGQDRAAARRHRVDGEHGRAQPHAGHHGIEAALEFAVVVRHVGRGPAHVEADEPREAGALRCLHRADDAAGRTGQDAVLAGEGARLGEPAARAHEHQRHTSELGRHPVDVAPQNGREIRVGHGGVAAPDQLHQRRDLVRHRDLGKADGARDACRRGFVGTIAPGMHEDDRGGAQTGIVGPLKLHPERFAVERPQHDTLRRDALVRLDGARMERFRQHDVKIEQARPILVGDAQGVAEAARDHQHGRFALALEQRIGRHRRAHLDRSDRDRRDRRGVRHAQNVADAGERRVAVAFRILRQELARDQPAVGRARHDIGERAAAVDPEMPGPAHDLITTRTNSTEAHSIILWFRSMTGSDGAAARGLGLRLVSVCASSAIGQSIGQHGRARTGRGHGRHHVSVPRRHGSAWWPRPARRGRASRRPFERRARAYAMLARDQAPPPGASPPTV